jgi:hypothetical protein
MHQRNCNPESMRITLYPLPFALCILEKTDDEKKPLE